MTQDIKSKDFVNSLARGLSIIRAFDADHQEMTLSEVAEKSAMTRAGARRFLLTLMNLGYVAKTERYFRLTPKILTLGYAYMSAVPLAELAQPYLDQVTVETGESSSMAVLDNFDIAYITRSRAQRLLMIGIHVGARLPACTTSMGRILLNNLSPDELDEYLAAVRIERHTERTILDKDELRTEIERARAQGYYVLDQELEVGLRSIAVPVVSQNTEQVVAAINIATNAAIVSKRRLMSDFLPILRGAAAKIRSAVV